MSCDHQWTAWLGTPGIKDMLSRQCLRCGERVIRILPPDVTPADVARQRSAVEWDDNWNDGGGE